MKKSLLWLLVVLLSTAMVAGFSLAEGKPVKFKDKIICGIIVEPKSLDPIYGNAQANDLNIYNLFYENLIEFVDGKIVPALAESYMISDDYLSIVFKLRKGIKFHDGTDFNADVVKWNLNRARTDPLSVSINELKMIKEVVVIDDYTVEIKLSEPYAPIFSALTLGAGCMVSPTAVEKFGEDFHSNPVGTGPYEFVEWVVGEKVTGKRFAGYWRKDADGIQLPYSDEVTVKIIPVPAVAFIELKAGNIDMMESTDTLDFEAAEKDPNLQVIPTNTGIHQWLAFNVNSKPFSNEKMRQAFSAAIDREELMEVITKGKGQVTPTYVTSADWIYNADLKTPYSTYNPELAKTLLAEAGYTKDTKITISVIQRDPDVQISELIQAQLKKLGIEVNIEILERQAWVSKILGRKYDMGILRINVPYPDPDTVFNINFGSADAPSNWSGIDDPEIFELVAKARHEFDKDKRYDLYTKIQQLVLDRAYYAFLFLRPHAILATKEVIDISQDIAASIRLGEIKVVAK